MISIEEYEALQDKLEQIRDIVCDCYDEDTGIEFENVESLREEIENLKEEVSDALEGRYFNKGLSTQQKEARIKNFADFVKSSDLLPLFTKMILSKEEQDVLEEVAQLKEQLKLERQKNKPNNIFTR